MRIIIYLFQLMDIFKTGSFAPMEWSWDKFLGLPMFSTNYQLFVDMVLLESHNLVTSSQSTLIANMQSKLVHYQREVRNQACPGDLESILQCGHKLDVTKEVLIRGSEAVKSTYDDDDDRFRQFRQFLFRDFDDDDRNRLRDDRDQFRDVSGSDFWLGSLADGNLHSLPPSCDE